jgi:hypothetical protein
MQRHFQTSYLHLIDYLGYLDYPGYLDIAVEAHRLSVHHQSHNHQFVVVEVAVLVVLVAATDAVPNCYPGLHQYSNSAEHRSRTPDP